MDVGNWDGVCAGVYEGFVDAAAVDEGHGVFFFGEGGIPGVEISFYGKEGGVVW